MKLNKQHVPFYIILVILIAMGVYVVKERGRQVAESAARLADDFDAEKAQIINSGFAIDSSINYIVQDLDGFSSYLLKTPSYRELNKGEASEHYIGYLSHGTRIELLEKDAVPINPGIKGYSSLWYKVRIKEGKHQGQEGWLTADAVSRI